MKLYSNPKSVALLKQLTTIALKAQGINPSPVDIKKQLAELDYHLLKEINENLSTALTIEESTQPRISKDYWICNCANDNVHSALHIDFCKKCNTNVEDGRFATIDEVSEHIAHHLSK